jgi:hypothetical protein
MCSISVASLTGIVSQRYALKRTARNVIFDERLIDRIPKLAIEAFSIRNFPPGQLALQQQRRAVKRFPNKGRICAIALGSKEMRAIGHCGGF